MTTNEGFPVAQQTHYEHAIDPNVGLDSVIQEFGFEGLDDNQRLGIIERATLDDYMIAADIIHRKVAPNEDPNIHPDPVKIRDPNTDEVRHLTAHPTERVDILAHALKNAQSLISMYKETGGDTKDVLKRCGNLAAVGLLLAHNWEEGNGRTARTLGELIQTGYDSSSSEQIDDLRTLSTNRPTGGYKIISYAPKGEWADKANAEPLAFLDAIAAPEVPFDAASYANVARQILATPRS